MQLVAFRTFDHMQLPPRANVHPRKVPPGGVARIGAVIAGVLIMGLVQNAMNLLNIPPFYQYVARGCILLAAVLLDRIKHRS